MDFLITPRHRWINVAILSVMGVTALNAYDAFKNLGASDNAYLGLFISLGKLTVIERKVLNSQKVTLLSMCGTS